jgi:antitoxin component YwqK of YwqJK toxin-antitoxin module
MSCDNKDSTRIDKYYSSGNLMYSVEIADSLFHGTLKYLNALGDTLMRQNWTNGLTDSDIYNYDKVLIDLFVENIQVNFDSLLYAGEYHKLEIYNFPSHPLMYFLTNAEAKKSGNYIYVRPLNNGKPVKISVQIRIDDDNCEILLIERKVKKMTKDEF